MTYCTHCGISREPGNRFCTGCGAQVSAASPTHPHSRGRFAIALTALVLVLGGGGVAAWATWAHGTTSSATPSPATRPDQPQAAPSPPDQNDPTQTDSSLLSNARVSASRPSSQPAPDAGNGTKFTYEPEKAIDGRADTAWRCDGDGIGEWLEISFQRKVTLTSIGIIPGFAKIDPYDHTDRYAQNRRISAVRYIFDDGSHFDKTFDTGVSSRSAQTLGLPGVSTGHVRITILDSKLGEATNGQIALNQIAISEITVSGR